MSDILVEHMVKRVMTPALRARQILFLVAGGAVLLVALMFSPMAGSIGFLFILAGVGAAYLAWRLARGQQVEFEYILTNGEFDLDKIIARSSRKQLLTFHCRDVEQLVPLKTGEKLPSGAIVACSSLEDKNLWRCTVKQPGHGSATFVFNPSDSLLAAMGKFLPASVRREALGNQP
ncbi:MAG: DUF6106 family protein [Oscillospiraceae bacterium]|jgi:hypothetical protein